MSVCLCGSVFVCLCVCLSVCLYVNVDMYVVFIVINVSKLLHVRRQASSPRAVWNPCKINKALNQIFEAYIDSFLWILTKIRTWLN